MRRFAKQATMLSLQFPQQLTNGSRCLETGRFCLTWVHLLPTLLPKFLAFYLRLTRLGLTFRAESKSWTLSLGSDAQSVGAPWSLSISDLDPEPSPGGI